MYSFDPTEEQKIVINAAKKLAQKEFEEKIMQFEFYWMILNKPPVLNE